MLRVQGIMVLKVLLITARYATERRLRLMIENFNSFQQRYNPLP